MRKLFWLMAVAGFMALAGCQVGPPPHTVKEVDFSRYGGKWFEISRMPVWFEEGCAGVTAEFTPGADGKTARLKLSWFSTREEKVRRIDWGVHVLDPPANTRLRVTFFWPFEGDFWILRLDNNYQYMALGSPDRDTLWILSRTPVMDQHVYDDMVDSLRVDGFKVEKLEKTPQKSLPE